MLYILALLLLFALSFWANQLVIKLFSKKKQFIIPAQHDLHTIPTPWGGGIAVISVILLSWFGLSFYITNSWDSTYNVYLVITIIVAIVSLLDDLKNISVSVRFIIYATCCIFTVFVLPSDNNIISNKIPWLLDRIISAISLTWFVNLYNFMDGMDGMTAIETISICLGLLLVNSLLPNSIIPYDLFAIIILGAILGFLPFNWHPAKIFIGDVGAVTLGYIIGLLLIIMAFNGYAYISFILPAYYLVDSTFTLFRRLMRKQSIFIRHSDFFFRLAINYGGLNQTTVNYFVIVNNMIIILAAYISTQGFVISGLLLAYLSSCFVVYLFNHNKEENKN